MVVKASRRLGAGGVNTWDSVPRMFCSDVVVLGLIVGVCYKCYVFVKLS